MRPLSAYETSVVPALRSSPEDQPEEEFHRVVNFLVVNYSAATLAGALINSTSCDLYSRLAQLANRVEK